MNTTLMFCAIKSVDFTVNPFAFWLLVPAVLLLVAAFIGPPMSMRTFIAAVIIGLSLWTGGCFVLWSTEALPDAAPAVRKANQWLEKPHFPVRRHRTAHAFG